jgi:hypothetical protein
MVSLVAVVLGRLTIRAGGTILLGDEAVYGGQSCGFRAVAISQPTEA